MHTSIKTWTWNTQQMEQQQIEINLHIYSIVTRIQIIHPPTSTSTTNRQILTIELIAFTLCVNYEQGFWANCLSIQQVGSSSSTLHKLNLYAYVVLNV